MANTGANVITTGMRGKLGDALVFKTMRGKTFVTHPARRPVKRNESSAQQNTRTNFRQASGWAQTILLDPERKAYYRQRARKLKLPNAYTAALTDYMRRPHIVKTSNRDTVTYTVSKPGFTLKNVSVAPMEEAETQAPHVAIRQLHDRWLVQCKVQNELFTPQIVVTDNCERVTLWGDGDSKPTSYS